MKKSSLLFTFLFLIIGTLCFSQRIKSGNDLKISNKILVNYIYLNYLKNQKDKPEEYKEARKFYYYDIDQDGDKDLISFFTLEGFSGGNNWQHYIGIFLNENGTMKFADDFVLFGDTFKKYHTGELVNFKNGYIYYKLLGEDIETSEPIVVTFGMTIFKKKIVFTKKLY